MTEYQENQLLDARGLLCPMPIVKAGKVMRGMEDGEVLKIIATDRGSIVDFPAWCEDTGNELLEWHEEDDGFVFFIKKVEEED
jgi:tRNA 2-thiouridine synthesizing protein A